VLIDVSKRLEEDDDQTVSGLEEILRPAAVKVKEGACALCLLLEREDPVVSCRVSAMGRGVRLCARQGRARLTR